jgi:hypothetical protein
VMKELHCGILGGPFLKRLLLERFWVQVIGDLPCIRMCQSIVGVAISASG